ncbi:MAG TPA: AbrB/MazE/SpoVT family DNA-binding domain-containing protein [Geobacteraceae bacterium]|nr:AbrB/MazE/SpoVT family DNA-binding domain-containing protein [Geobacteraceae bacterium]
MEALAKVSTKGQVVIPAELRKRHHLEPGASVHVYEYGDLICLAPVVADPVEEAWGTLKGGASLVDELLEMRRKDFAGE